MIQFYMDLFRSFEKVGMKIDDTWHMFVLQYLFIPRIQEDLDHFKNIWNNHALSTEQNRTPLQLLILRRDSIAPDVFVDENEYGLDDDAEDVDEAVAEHFRVPCDPIICPLSPHNLALFKLNVQPLSMATHTSDLEELYYATLRYVLQIKQAQLN